MIPAGKLTLAWGANCGTTRELVTVAAIIVRFLASGIMRQITYTDAQIIAMSDVDVKRLGLLCPKCVYYQMETSGSPSAWTDYGEYLAGTKGADIVRCAMEIRDKHEECEEYNRHFGNHWNYEAHIRVIF